MAKNPYDIASAFQKIEEELIKSMRRNQGRHLREEGKTQIIYTQWQAEQLKALKEFRSNNKKLFKRYFLTIDDDISDMLKTSYKGARNSQERKILKAIKRGSKLPKHSASSAAFFNTDEKKLKALIKEAQEGAAKAETAILRMANDQYRQTIFNAQVYLNSGAGTLKNAIDMANASFLKAGFNVIQYSNGARVSAKRYAEMALRTANTRAKLQGDGEMRKEWGLTLVKIAPRGDGCPLCTPFQGKVFIDDVWSGGTAKDGDYPLLSSAISAGLYHPNCKDIHHTYYGDIENPPKAPTEKQKREEALTFEREQKQNYINRQIDRYKRLELGSQDDNTRIKYSNKRKEWEAELLKY